MSKPACPDPYHSHESISSQVYDECPSCTTKAYHCMAEPVSDEKRNIVETAAGPSECTCPTHELCAKELDMWRCEYCLANEDKPDYFLP